VKIDIMKIFLSKLKNEGTMHKFFSDFQISGFVEFSIKNMICT